MGRLHGKPPYILLDLFQSLYLKKGSGFLPVNTRLPVNARLIFILFLLFPPSGDPTWFPDILGNSSYPIFTKFGMQVYWVNSLYGIAFGDDSSIANGVIATLLLLSISLVSRHFKECY